MILCVSTSRAADATTSYAQQPDLFAAERLVLHPGAPSFVTRGNQEVLPLRVLAILVNKPKKRKRILNFQMTRVSAGVSLVLGSLIVLPISVVTMINSIAWGEIAMASMGAIGIAVGFVGFWGASRLFRPMTKIDRFWSSDEINADIERYNLALLHRLYSARPRSARAEHTAAHIPPKRSTPKVWFSPTLTGARLAVVF